MSRHSSTLVAQRDGLLDVLEADRPVGEPGDRQRARHRADGHHEDVVLELVRLALERLRRSATLRAWSTAGDRAGDDLGVAQGLAQRHDRVPRLDRAGARLGQERLVGHVRARVDDGDHGLAALQLLAEPQRGVHADVAAADDEDAWRRRAGLGCRHAPRLGGRHRPGTCEPGRLRSARPVSWSRPCRSRRPHPSWSSTSRRSSARSRRCSRCRRGSRWRCRGRGST